MLVYFYSFSHLTFRIPLQGKNVSDLHLSVQSFTYSGLWLKHLLKMLANGKTRVFSFHLCHNFIPTLFAFWQKRRSSHFLGKNVSSFPMPRNSCYLWNHCFEAIAGYGVWQQGLGEEALLAEGRCNDNFILLCSLPSAACCFPWTFSVLPHAFLLSFSRCSSSFSFCGGIACSFRPGYTSLWYIYVEKLECTGLNSHLRLIPLISLFGSIYQAHTHTELFLGLSTLLPQLKGFLSN